MSNPGADSAIDTAEAPTPLLLPSDDRRLPTPQICYMDALPLEMLHRIARLLDPKTFYLSFSCLLHRIRDASLSAIPGCRNGRGVARCTIVVSWDGEQPERRKNIIQLQRFEMVNHRIGNALQTVWASCTLNVHMSFRDAAPNRNIGQVITGAIVRLNEYRQPRAWNLQLYIEKMKLYKQSPIFCRLRLGRDGVPEFVRNFDELRQGLTILGEFANDKPNLTSVELANDFAPTYFQEVA